MKNFTAVFPDLEYNEYYGNNTEEDQGFYERIDYIANILHVFSMVVYSVAFLLGTVGNGLVIYFTAFRMKRTVNVVWFLNLAIADFIFTFFLPLSVAYLALNFHWPFGTFMCKLNSTIAFINLYASIFLLTVISMDRCISVLFPVWCQNHRTPKLASFVALGVWIIAFVFSLPYFIFRDTEAYNGTISCFNNFEDDITVEEPTDLAISRHSGTVVTRFIVGFAIPFILIISCYSIILLRIQRNHMTTSSKPFKVVIAVIISFFVCWFPYHVFSFVELSITYGPDRHFSYAVFIGIPLSSSLAFINSCVNPVLYVFMGRDFKEKFRTSFQAIFEKAFTEDSGQLDSKSKTKSTSDSHVL
ncbi:chemerin-like receptor 1 [Hyperolius riggenbachi]|uniref:chemerin-like receptor 1 n=1 Tax=Hyperolius riggenbachi TaxID=752182 RepID=UPI0035A28B2E